MDLTPNNNSTYTLDTNTQTTQPTNTNTSNSSSFTNGTLKHHHSTTAATVAAAAPPPSMVVSYKECLKNHAASIGGHALDGCGEFMPSSSSNPTQPRSLTCAACGCHRNFHRRDNTQQQEHYYYSNPNFISFYHSPPPPSTAAPPLAHRGLSLSTSPSSLSPSPSPISSPSSPPPLSHHFPPSYAPHTLLSLGNACSDDHHHRRFFNASVAKAENNCNNNNNNNTSGKKRNRTRFSQEQKEKMHDFSERLGWKMNKGDEGLVQEFCNDIGVPRGVFKVWMHNNKNTFRKRSLETIMGNSNAPSDEKINGDHHSGNGGGGSDSDVNNSLQHK